MNAELRLISLLHIILVINIFDASGNTNQDIIVNDPKHPFKFKIPRNGKLKMKIKFTKTPTFPLTSYNEEICYDKSTVEANTETEDIQKKFNENKELNAYCETIKKNIDDDFDNSIKPQYEDMVYMKIYITTKNKYNTTLIEAGKKYSYREICYKKDACSVNIDLEKIYTGTKYSAVGESVTFICTSPEGDRYQWSQHQKGDIHRWPQLQKGFNEIGHIGQSVTKYTLIVERFDNNTEIQLKGFNQRSPPHYEFFATETEKLIRNKIQLRILDPGTTRYEYTSQLKYHDHVDFTCHQDTYYSQILLINPKTDKFTSYDSTKELRLTKADDRSILCCLWYKVESPANEHHVTRYVNNKTLLIYQQTENQITTQGITRSTALRPDIRSTPDTMKSATQSTTIKPHLDTIKSVTQSTTMKSSESTTKNAIQKFKQSTTNHLGTTKSTTQSAVIKSTQGTTKTHGTNEDTTKGSIQGISKSTTIDTNESTTESSPRDSTEGSLTLVYIIVPVVTVIGLLLIVVTYRKRCRKKTQEALELETYSTANRILYADLDVVRQQTSHQPQREESPYAQIIGFLAPPTKRR